MKKIFFMLVMIFAATSATNAQIITNMDDHYLVAGGMVYSKEYIPGSWRLSLGDNLSQKINLYVLELQRSSSEACRREYNLYLARGGMAAIQPVGTAAQFGYTTGMMAGVGMGTGVAMVGTGMNNSGMVMGSGGVAGANSRVDITNGNLISTIGSGVNVMYDSNSGSVNVSGDPLMAIGRVVSAVGSGVQSRKAQKAARQQTAAQQSQQPQVQVIYVDANTGQVIGQSQPTTTTTRTAAQAQAQPQYRYTYNATTGQYVPVQQATQQVQTVQQQPVQQQGQQVQQVKNQTNTTNTYSGF